MEIAGEMQVHLFHRHDLRYAATCSAALHAEVRPKRGFANTDHGLFADAVQTIAQAHGRRGLAFARRRRVDRGHQNQLAVFLACQRFDELLAHFGLVMAIGQQVFGRDAQLCANLHDRLFLGFACNFDVGFEGHFFLPEDATTIAALNTVSPRYTVVRDAGQGRFRHVPVQIRQPLFPIGNFGARKAPALQSISCRKQPFKALSALNF